MPVAETTQVAGRSVKLLLCAYFAAAGLVIAKAVGSAPAVVTAPREREWVVAEVACAPGIIRLQETRSHCVSQRFPGQHSISPEARVAARSHLPIGAWTQRYLLQRLRTG